MFLGGFKELDCGNMTLGLVGVKKNHYFKQASSGLKIYLISTFFHSEAE